MSRDPDFIIIGAMKCATSTLHEQLALQRGVVMSEPKEPNFFSDDDVWARGIDWYRSLFAAAGPDDLAGESSTHYTKLPAHPRVVERVREHLGDRTRFIYVMRHPVRRLLSQHVHEWSQRNVSAEIEQALREMPAMIEYSRYAMQLRPWLEAFGRKAVLPVFFERLVSHPQEQLERVARFIGLAGPVRWDESLAAQNRADQRERRSTVREALRRVPGARRLLHAVVPGAAWSAAKRRLWQLRRRPELAPATRARLEAIFDDDLAELGRWLAIDDLRCATFAEAVNVADPRWRAAPAVAAR